MAVLLLSALFESHIYVVSSLFLGFVLGAVPLIVKEEAECLKKKPQGFIFSLVGLALVVGITMANGQSGAAAMDLAQFSIPSAVKLFLIGTIAISAMFLPGISDSTLLWIFGAYIPAYKPDQNLTAITDKLWAYGYQIIVVDDGRGEEYQQGREAVEKDSVIKKKVNGGCGKAIRK